MTEAVTTNTSQSVHVDYKTYQVVIILVFNDIVKVKSRVISITPNDTTSLGSLTPITTVHYYTNIVSCINIQSFGYETMLLYQL